VNASFGLFGLLLAQPVGGWGHAWGGGPWAFFPFFPLMPLAWLAVGLAVVLVLRKGRPRDRSGLDRAGAILDERYARGEISSDEYRERVEHLRAQPR